MSAPIQAGGLSTFEQLVESVGDYLGRSDLRDQIPDFIRLVEKELERDIPLRDSEFVKDDAFKGADEEFITLPSNLLELRHIRINTQHPYSINIVGIDKLNDIRTNGSSLSLPSAGAHIGDKLYLAPTPKLTTGYTLVYRGSIAGLSDANPSNRILEDAPDCLLYGALMHSAVFIGADDRVGLWSEMFNRAKNSYRMLEHRNRTGGGPLQIRPDTIANDLHSFRGR
jgi:hypothetical protein